MARDEVTRGAIWWAVDPFHDDAAFHEHAIAVLTPFARALSVVIHPVTFIDAYRALEPAGQRFPLLPVGSEPLGELRAAVEEHLALLSQKAPDGVMGAPVVLTHEPGAVPGLRDRVDAISAEANKHSAAFVALHSHSRTGLGRLYMGSFAETFVLYSQEPTLVFNPTCAVSPRLRRAVFPTDFSAESARACATFQTLCLKLGVPLSIANVQPWYESLEILQPRMRADVEAQKRDRARGAENLAAEARGRGVDAEAVILKACGSDNPSGPILEFATGHQVDLIALAAQSGPLMTALVGATSRSIAREAHCPVLIYRSRPAG